MKEFGGYSTLLWGILIGLALGLAVNLLGLEGDWAVRECETGDTSWYCFFNVWQDLTAGFIAIGGALVAAAVAWSAAMKQVRVTANIPIVLRQFDLDRENFRLQQILTQLEVFKIIANAYLTSLDPIRNLKRAEIRDELSRWQHIPRADASILGNLAESRSEPVLRSELKRAEGIMSDFEKQSIEMETLAHRDGMFHEPELARLKGTVKQTYEDAQKLSASFDKIERLIARSLVLNEEEQAALHMHKFKY